MVRQEYEERIKGLMPAALQQELEDTITSLKAQVRPRCLPDTNQTEFKALYSLPGGLMLFSVYQICTDAITF